MKPLTALCQVQDEIGAHRELSFFELSHTAVYHVRIAMDEKNSERPSSVRGGALRPETRQVRLEIALSQI